MKKIILFFLLIVISASTSYSVVGQTGWQIMRRAQSARPQPLNNIIAVNADLSGVFYNSAILGTLNNRKVSLLSESGSANDTFGGVLYGQPLGNTLGICVGYIYYDAGKMTLDWMEGSTEYTNTVTSQKDTLAVISAGKALSSKLLAGVTLKYATNNIAEVKEATAYAGDIGLIYMLNNKLNISLSGQNFGSSTKFITKAEELPTTVSFGISYLVPRNDRSYIGLAVDVPYILKEERVVPNIGLEYCLGKVAFDIGYRLNVEESQLQVGFSAGISRNLELGYAFIPASYLSSTHRLNLGYRF
ncbi:MAG: hypothetical protein A2252_06200 [Elusimicrobia bacterium RIFOXYA2_FULL_39_19]|nr:MAG: hypothetical protein A2252_06200 [Elusimicrobia bacterium RIFOXYA2_FULL_39_19]